MKVVKDERPWNVFTWGNFISLLRPITGTYAILLFFQGHAKTATCVFLIAALTDYFDGKVARKRGVSRFGEIFDPICDKLLIVPVIFMQPYLFGVIAVELVSSAFSIYVRKERRKKNPEDKHHITGTSKWATAFQFTALTLLFTAGNGMYAIALICIIYLCSFARARSYALEAKRIIEIKKLELFLGEIQKAA